MGVIKIMRVTSKLGLGPRAARFRFGVQGSCSRIQGLGTRF